MAKAALSETAITINRAHLMLLNEEQQKAFDAILAEAQKLANIEIGSVSSSIEENALNEFLSRGKKAEKVIDKTRRSVTDPLNEQVKAVNDLFRPLTDAVKIFLVRGGGVLLAYQSAQRRERERLEREARVEQEALKRKEEEAFAKAEAATTEAERRVAVSEASIAATNQALIKSQISLLGVRGCSTDSGKSNTRRIWTFKIEDDKKIPREYLALDEKKVRGAIDFGLRHIPGIRIFEQEVLAIRTK